MATNVPVGFGQAAFIFTGSIGTPEFVTTIGVDLGDVGGNFVGAANHLLESYGAAFMGTTSDLLSLNRVQLNIGLEEGGTGSVLSTVAPWPGADAGDIPPINVGAILQKQTLRLGRAGRGRMFLPGILNITQVTEGGRLDPTAAEGLADAGNDFLEYINAPDAPSPAEPTITPMVPVLLHSGTMLPTPIVGAAIAPLVGVVRKRVR